jgi:hypothetical protein
MTHYPMGGWLTPLVLAHERVNVGVRLAARGRERPRPGGKPVLDAPVLTASGPSESDHKEEEGGRVVG